MNAVKVQLLHAYYKLIQALSTARNMHTTKTDKITQTLRLFWKWKQLQNFKGAQYLYDVCPRPGTVAFMVPFST